MPDLANPRAERVRAMAALAGRSARERRGRFLVEGPQAVRELVVHRPADVEDLVATTAAADRHPEIVAAAHAAGLAVRTATPEVVDAVSRDAQGVVAVARTTTPGGEAVPRAPRLVAVLASVRDPGNAGTVIRVADAAGADAVILAGDCVETHNPKVVRASVGSLFHLPVVRLPLGEAVAQLHAAGLQVLAADGSGDLDLEDLADAAGRGAGPGAVDLAAPTAWLFGNEAWGLPEADLALADARVRIPLRGAAESLNLATAAAVCLFASARAHR